MPKYIITVIIILGLIKKGMYALGGFFGLFDYNKAGAGVSKNAPKKRRLFLFFEIYFRRFWKLILLNILYFVFCIPIITIGPATSGFVFVLRNFSQERHADVVSDFFSAFRKNFKQSFLMGIIDFIFVVLMSVSIYFYFMRSADNSFLYFPLIICISMTIIFIMMHFYIHLMIVTLDLKLKPILKNAFFLSFLGIKTNAITFLLLIVLNFPLILLPFTMEIAAIPLLLMFVAIFPLSLSGFIICFNSYQYIQKFVIDPYYKEIGEENPEYAHLAKDEDAVFKDRGGDEKPIKSKPRVKGKRIK